MNFHSFYTAEMSSPAAKRLSNQLELKSNESKQQPSTPLMGLTPRQDKNKKRGKSSRKREKKLKRSHEKRVKSELHDVMTRASDDLKGVLQGKSGMMLTGGFLTPLQEKLRAANPHSVWQPIHSSSSSPSIGSKNRARRTPREYIDPWSQAYVDKYEVGGPTAVQLASYRDPRLERQLSKILSLSSELHADSMVSLRTLCGRCENQVKWLTHSDRARMYVFDDLHITAGEGGRRLVYFRQNGGAEYVDLSTLTTPTTRLSQRTAAPAPDNAFLGLIPRKNNTMQAGIQNALANLITTGRSTEVPPVLTQTGRSSRSRGLERPPATATWCFPIANDEDTNILALLVVVMAKNPLTVRPSFSASTSSSSSSSSSDPTISTNTIRENHNLNYYKLDHSKESDDDGASSSQDETSSNQSLGFDEDKYSVDEAALFSKFLTNVAIALRNCTKRNRELDKSAHDTDTLRNSLQAQVKAARTKLKEEEEKFKIQLRHEEEQYKSQLQHEEEQYKAQLQHEEAVFQAQRVREEEKVRAAMEVQETKRKIERETEKAKLEKEREDRERERQEQKRDMDTLREEHADLINAERNEHHKLEEQERQLRDAREALTQERQTGVIELEHERILTEQVAQLESEVKRQKSRALHAQRMAAKSKEKLPVAMESLRRLSFVTFHIQGTTSEADDEKTKEENVASLFRVIVDTTVNILEAERVTLYLLNDDGTKLVGHQFSDHLTVGTVPDPNNKKLTIQCDRTVGICGHVATTRQLFNIRDVYDDVRFDRSVDMRTGFRTKSMLVCPILSARGEVLGVLQAMNKRVEGSSAKAGDDADDGDAGEDKDEDYGDETYFTQDDEQVIQMLTQHASMAIEHSQGLRDDHHMLKAAAKQLENVQKELARHDNESAMLLDAAHDIAVELDYDDLDRALEDEDDEDLENKHKTSRMGTFLVPMFAKVVAHARRLCQADRASLFFCDWEGRRLWSAVAEGVTTMSSTGEGPIVDQHNKVNLVIEVPMGRGVVGRVAETGKPIVTADARSLPFFDDTHDRSSGYRTKSILCVPILLKSKKKEESVSAVLMLINKLKADTSSKIDDNSLNNTASRLSSPRSPRSRRQRDEVQMESGADAVFDEHDLDLAERLAAQVSGPVAHAQEMMSVARRHTGSDKKIKARARENMEETEKRATKQLRKIEGTLRSKVADERSRASKMLSVLSLGASVAADGATRDVGKILSDVLNEVRSVMGADSVVFHMHDRERKILWPRSSSGKVSQGAVLSGNGTTSLSDGGGGNRATANVAKAAVTSSSTMGREACRRACAMTGETIGKTLTVGEKGTQNNEVEIIQGLDILCVAVMGRDEGGRELVLGVLEAVYPTPAEVVGAEATDSVFLLAVCTQVGAVLTEEHKAKSRVIGEETAAKAMKILQEQIAKIKRDEERMGTTLKRERRLSRAARVLAKDTRFRSGKHGVMADLFGRSVAAVTGLVNADRGSLFLVDGSKGMLRTTNMHASDDEKTSSAIEFIEIPIQPNSIAGSCAITGQITNVPDAYRDARFHRAIDVKTGYRTRSMLTVPVLSVCSVENNSQPGKDAPGQVIAVLQLINKKEGLAVTSSSSNTNGVIPFDKDDVDLVKKFVLQVAPSIRDALQQEAAAHEVAASHQHLREVELRLAKEREAAEMRQKELEHAKKQVEDDAKQGALKAEKVAQMISERNQRLEKELNKVKEKNKRLEKEMNQTNQENKRVTQMTSERNQHLEKELNTIKVENKRLEKELNQTKQENKQFIGLLEKEKSEMADKEMQFAEALKKTKEELEDNRRLVGQTFLTSSSSPDVATSSSSPDVANRRNITRVGRNSEMRKLLESRDEEEYNTMGSDDDNYLTAKGRGGTSSPNLQLKKKKRRQKTKKRTTLAEKGGTTIHFGLSSLFSPKKNKGRGKNSKKKKMKRKSVKSVAATLSSEGGGPVIVSIDRSIFTARSHHSPKRRRNRFFGSPASMRATKSPSKSPASSRLLFGFAPPPTTSYTPETGGMKY